MSELTEEWLELFHDSKTKGENFAASAFWQMALLILPVGVDASDARVIAAVDEIRRASVTTA